MRLPDDTSGCAGKTGCVRAELWREVGVDLPYSTAGGYDPPLRYPCAPQAHLAPQGISCRKAYRESRRDLYRILVGEDRIFPFRCCSGRIISAPTVRWQECREPKAFPSEGKVAKRERSRMRGTRGKAERFSRMNCVCGAYGAWNGPLLRGSVFVVQKFVYL